MRASTMICVPTSLAQEVGTALGAQAGEARLREVITAGGFGSVRRRPRRRSTWCWRRASSFGSVSRAASHGRRRRQWGRMLRTQGHALDQRQHRQPGCEAERSAEAAVIRARSRSPATSRPTSTDRRRQRPRRSPSRAVGCGC